MEMEKKPSGSGTDAAVRERSRGIDVLRGIAAFFIAGRHLAMYPRVPECELMVWFCDMFVMVFGAVSGFLLPDSLARAEGAADFMKKKALRIIPVYLFWVAAFIALTAVFDIFFDGGALNPKFADPKFWIFAILDGGGSTHLWYLAELFYCSSAVCAIWFAFGRMSRSPVFWWIAALVLLPPCAIWPECGHGPLLRLPCAMSLGVAFRLSAGKHGAGSAGVWAAVSAVALAFHFSAGFFSPHLPPAIRDFIVAVALLGLAVSLRNRGGKFFGWLGARSLGVYVIHPVFTIGVGYLLKKTSAPPYSLSLNAAYWAAVAVCSVAAAHILSRFRATAWTCGVKAPGRRRKEQATSARSCR